MKFCSKLEACRKPFFNKVNEICPMFLKSMGTSDKFIMTSNDYDLNVLCGYVMKETCCEPLRKMRVG